MSTPVMCGRSSTSPKRPRAAICSCPVWTSPAAIWHCAAAKCSIRSPIWQNTPARRSTPSAADEFDFDTTKLSVHTLDIGLAGIEVYDILRDEYDIQIEFGDIGNILAYLSIGDRPQEVERLVSALAEIKRRYSTDGTGLLSQEYIDPEVAASPQEAFYAPKKSLPLRETEGMVCSEFVMCYPPGIPILAPGERITAEILDYIEYAKAKGCSMTGPEDPDILRLNVLA